MCMCVYIYIYTYIHTYIHACMHACMHTYIHTYLFCFAERLPQTLSDARGSTNGGSRQTGRWPERRIKGVRPNARKVRTQQPVTRNLNCKAPKCLSGNRRGGPPRPFRYLQVRSTQYREGAATYIHTCIHTFALPSDLPDAV